METSEIYSPEWAVLTTSFQHSISGGVKAGKLTFKAAPPQLTCLSVPKHHKDLGADLTPNSHTGVAGGVRIFLELQGFISKRKFG